MPNVNPYVPTQGVFVDGTIADAADFLNEFGAISTTITEIIGAVADGDTSTLSKAKLYTDTELKSFNVDGGTF